jgi:hypothetical protein
MQMDFHQFQRAVPEEHVEGPFSPEKLKKLLTGGLPQDVLLEVMNHRGVLEAEGLGPPFD